MAEVFDNVWDALEDDPVERESLKVKSYLMFLVGQHIKENNLTQARAAELMGVNQPRVSNLIRGKIDLFTIDMLVDMLSRAGLKVEITLTRAA
jgi:predicted XRE-type DNA-binding protein